MADITQLILTKYYGFGAHPENKKFLSSHDGTYDPNNYHRKSFSSDPSGAEAAEMAPGQRTSQEIVKDKLENLNPGESGGTIIVRSSRAIPDDETLDDEECDIYEYEALVNSPECRNDCSPNEEKKISNWNDLLNAKLEEKDQRDEIIRNESNVGLTEDIIPDNLSDISSIPSKKKMKKKSFFTTPTSTLSSQPPVRKVFAPQPPKKLPACNGVFLDLTNLSLVAFPTDILANIPNLRMLYLENNSLTELPERLFSSLKLLQWLDVRNNKLSTLPKNIRYHTCLETILLEGNLFETLPLELCLIPSLKVLQTSRNPLTFPPADILALGFAATINCLRSQWNKLNPDEIIESPGRDKKPKPSTILCSDPPILRTLSKSSRIFGSSSTGHVTEGARRISIRKKTWNYKPSNRCENRGTDEELETRLLWIAQVKEMLTKQAIELQKVKDRDALSNWRRDRKSYEKSMNRAANRNEEDIPFGIDLEDFRGIFKNRSKTGTKFRKQGPAPIRNINEKMSEIYESLNRLQITRKSDTLSPRVEQKLLENEIKKLSKMQEEIQNLILYNETTTAPFQGSEMLPQTHPYNPPPSIIL